METIAAEVWRDNPLGYEFQEPPGGVILETEAEHSKSFQEQINELVSGAAKPSTLPSSERVQSGSGPAADVFREYLKP